MKIVLKMKDNVIEREVNSINEILSLLDKVGHNNFKLDITEYKVVKEINKGYLTLRNLAPIILNITTYMDKGDEYASKAYSIAFQLYKYMDYIISSTLEGNKVFTELAYAISLYLNRGRMDFIYDFIDYVLENSQCIAFNRQFIHEWFTRYIEE